MKWLFLFFILASCASPVKCRTVCPPDVYCYEVCRDDWEKVDAEEE